MTIKNLSNKVTGEFKRFNICQALREVLGATKAWDQCWGLLPGGGATSDAAAEHRWQISLSPVGGASPCWADYLRMASLSKSRSFFTSLALPRIAQTDSYSPSKPVSRTVKLWDADLLKWCSLPSLLPGTWHPRRTSPRRVLQPALEVGSFLPAPLKWQIGTWAVNERCWKRPWRSEKSPLGADSQAICIPAFLLIP